MYEITAKEQCNLDSFQCCSHLIYALNLFHRKYLCTACSKQLNKSTSVELRGQSVSESKRAREKERERR